MISNPTQTLTPLNQFPAHQTIGEKEVIFMFKRLRNTALWVLPTLGASAAFAEASGTDQTPAAVSALYADAAATIQANIPLITTILVAGFGIVVAFIVYKWIKRGMGRAG